MASRNSKAKRKGKSNKAGQRPSQLVTAPVSHVQNAFLELKPQPANGESAEDLAIFTKAAREKLSADSQSQAAAVALSLELIHKGSYDPALAELKAIPHGSIYADWRLLARGLIAYYRGDLEAARKNWDRLDPSRRPARIANTLLVAENQPLIDSKLAAPPTQLVEAAKELRNRPALVAAARRIGDIKHRSGDTSFSGSQVTLLRDFHRDFRKFDAEFVAQFSQACLRLAYFQANSDTFDSLKKIVPGPAHDPHWNLLTFSYYIQFRDANDLVQKAAAAYVKTDLPSLLHLPKELRGAIASELHYIQAMRTQLPSPDTTNSMFPFFSVTRGPTNLRPIEDLFRQAANLYPAHRDAHNQLISIIQRQCESNNLTSSAEEALEKRLVEAKRNLIKVFPDEVETTLSLIDYYFDQDDLETAEALVQRLNNQRLDSPLARALPWKLKLREAMRQSRKKNSLNLARVALEEAATIWPQWLSRDWLPFLQAALELRNGNKSKFEQLYTEGRQAGKIPLVAGDVMAFAAFQQMNIPSAELKPLRQRIDQHAAAAVDIKVDELCHLGSFLWDLTRTGFRHKAYRLQASKFGKAFCKQLASGRQPPLDSTFFGAVDWAGSHSFWINSFDRSPAWVEPYISDQPRVAAAILQRLLNLEYGDRQIAGLGKEIALLVEAAKTEKDPFYRFRFGQIAKEAGIQASEFEARSRERFSSFSNMADDDEDDDEDDYFSEYDDDDDDAANDLCDCQNCRRKRQAQMRGLGDEFNEDEAGDFFGALPPAIGRIFKKLGPKGITELQETMEQLEDDTSPKILIQKFTMLFVRHGLSPIDLAEFLSFVERTNVLDSRDDEDDGFDFERLPKRLEPESRLAGLTVEQVRAAKQQRQKQLKAKMNRRR